MNMIILQKDISKSIQIISLLFALIVCLHFEWIHCLLVESQGKLSTEAKQIHLFNGDHQYGQCCESGKLFAKYHPRTNCQPLSNSRWSSSRRSNVEPLFIDDGHCRTLWTLCCMQQQQHNQCIAGLKWANEDQTKHDECVYWAHSDKWSVLSNLTHQCCAVCLIAHDLRHRHGAKICSMNWWRALMSDDPPGLSPLQSTDSDITLNPWSSSMVEQSFRHCCVDYDSEVEQINSPKHNERNLMPIKLNKELNGFNRRQKTNLDNCKPGFELNPSTGLCVDIDECAVNKDFCADRSKGLNNCVNTIGSYRCSQCGPGFVYRPLDKICVDVNECLEHKPCLAGQSCMNTIGSYKCFCQIGFVMDPATNQCKDVNECQLGTHNCHESLRCDNTIGSFHCVRVQDCGTGYTINADHDICEDVDECALGLHNCGSGYQCRNTKGSFKCDRINCPSAQQRLVNGICVTVKCESDHVFNTTLGTCVTVDPCENKPCKIYERCIGHRSGGYSCVQLCEPGYEYNLTTLECSDVDECKRGLAECGPRQQCVNLIGHYDCRCDTGFVMDSQRNCVDIDECANIWACPHPYMCVNTAGSYRCDQCMPGYSADSWGDCVDVDECFQGTHNCDQQCVNAVGSFMCSCREGYQLGENGHSCVDIDECVQVNSARAFGHNQHAPANVNCVGVCHNTIGSYHCQCPNGFRKHHNRCIDINECSENSSLCSSSQNESCVNLLGSFRCVQIDCPLGFRKIVSFKSIQCIYNDTKSSFPDKDPYNRYEYLYYSLYNNQSIHGATGYMIYAVRFDEDIKYPSYYSLRLVSASSANTEDSHFKLVRHRPNEAKVTILKPLVGPQTAKLELISAGYRNGIYYRQKTEFTLDISQYNIM